MKKTFNIIYTFIVIGIQSIGNISSLIAILELELIKKHNWISKDDLLDSISLGRCGPGAAVINTIAFLGNKLYGFWGGVISTISFCISPFFIFIIISNFIDTLLENPIIESIFKSILVSICIMIVKTIWNLLKKSIIDKLTLSVFLLSLALAIFTDLTPIIYIIISIIFSFFIKFVIKINKKNFVE